MAQIPVWVGDGIVFEFLWVEADFVVEDVGGGEGAVASRAAVRRKNGRMRNPTWNGGISCAERKSTEGEGGLEDFLEDDGTAELGAVA